MNYLIKYFKLLLVTPTAFIIACNTEINASESKSIHTDASIETKINSIDKNANIKNQIVLYMKAHDLWGLEKSSKSEAQYYRLLIKKLPKNKYLVQDFNISGKKLTDPYILTDGKLDYTDNEEVAHHNNYYPREGARVVWFGSGNKKIESYYKNNMPSGIWIEYFENGQKKSENRYSGGVLHGITKTWNQDGVLTGECHYIFGNQDGRCYSKHSIYTENHIYDGEYKNGEKIGIWKQWNRDGSIEKITYHDPITIDLLKKSFSGNQFKNFIFDVNDDGIKDVVVTSASNNSNIYQGSELYVFVGNKNNRYKLSLETSNFTNDGGYRLYDIIPRSNSSGLIIRTYFPDRGNYNQDYYIDYRDNHWLLDKVSYHGNINNLEVQSYRCVVNQNINLASNDYTIKDGLVGSSDEVLKHKCPVSPSKYIVKTEKAEILNENFNSNTPPNYYIKNDIIDAIEQNEDWVKVSYKNNTKLGWIDKRQLVPTRKYP